MEELLLSDIQIMRRLVESNEKCIFVSPLINPVAQIGPSSLDVHLGAEIQTANTSNDTHIDLSNRREVNIEKHFSSRRVGIDGFFVLHPGEFMLASTLEFIRLPRDIAARLEGRSSIGRLGIEVHSTAGFIDPGFDGTLTFELSNVGRIPVKLQPGLRHRTTLFLPHRRVPSAIRRKVCGRVRAHVESDQQRSLTVR